MRDLSSSTFQRLLYGLTDFNRPKDSGAMHISAAFSRVCNCLCCIFIRFQSNASLLEIITRSFRILILAPNANRVTCSVCNMCVLHRMTSLRMLSPLRSSEEVSKLAPCCNCHCRCQKSSSVSDYKLVVKEGELPVPVPEFCAYIKLFRYSVAVPFQRSKVSPEPMSKNDKV